MEARYNVYGTKDTEIISKIESDFMEFSNGYKVNHWTIPALINGNVLRKCGYFRQCQIS